MVELGDGFFPVFAAALAAAETCVGGGGLVAGSAPGALAWCDPAADGVATDEGKAPEEPAALAALDVIALYGVKGSFVVCHVVPPVVSPLEVI